MGKRPPGSVQETETPTRIPSVLRYFDKDKPLTIQVDTSIYGLGAVLLQENGPIEYTSKSPSDAETRYS